MVEDEDDKPTQEDSFSLFDKDEWDKVRVSKDEFTNIFEEEIVIEENNLAEANGVNAEAAKELKQWTRKDTDVECFLTIKKGGLVWEMVVRRVTTNSNTGEVILGLEIDHSIKKDKT